MSGPAPNAGAVRSIAVFCGSKLGSDPAFADAARAVGLEAARRGLTVVYGGGRVGLMGVMAEACLDAGGSVVGVIPRAMVDAERALDRSTELIVVRTMHERKQAMHDRADAIVALPGGVGTFEELLEALAWDLLDIQSKPIGVLDLGGYYRDLLALMQRAREAGFVSDATMGHLVFRPEPVSLLDEIERRADTAREPRLGLRW